MKRALGKQHRGKAGCVADHWWPATWKFINVPYIHEGRQVHKSEEVVEPKKCPTCGAVAIRLKEERKQA